MKGIHPEFLLGRKGGHYESVINGLACFDDPEGDWQENIDSLTGDSRTKKLLATEVEFYDKATKTKIAGRTSWYEHKSSILRNIRKSKSIEVYRVSNNFFEDVKALRKQIPHAYITEEDQPFFISFKPHKVGPFNFNGAYVQMFSKGYDGAACLNIMLTVADHYSVMMARSLMIVDPTGSFDLATSLREEAITEPPRTLIQSDMVFRDRAEARVFNGMVTAIINTAVYTNSKDPDIENLRPLRFYDKKSISSISADRRENLCTLPVRLIHWNYHRKFNVDSTNVRSHMRWQPCGPGRTEIKLIWVDEHVRHFNKSLDTTTPIMV